MTSIRLMLAAMPTARRVALVATGATLALTVLILGSSVVLRSAGSGAAGVDWSP